MAAFWVGAFPYLACFIGDDVCAAFSAFAQEESVAALGAFCKGGLEGIEALDWNDISDVVLVAALVADAYWV